MSDSPRVMSEPQIVSGHELLAEERLLLGELAGVRILRVGHLTIVARYRNRRSRRRFVVKLSRWRYDKVSRARRRLRKEVDVARRVRHPGLVEVVGLRRFGPSLALFMPDRGLAPIRTLADDEGRIGVRTAVHLMAQVADAVGHLHAADLIHLDLKPENLLVSKSGCPVVCDYGLVRARGVGGRGIYLGGTPGYLCPEQSGVSAHGVRPESDVFGMAATLSSLITGRPPIEPAGRKLTRRRLLSMRAEPLDVDAWIPRQLRDVARRALAFDPADRPASASEFAAELRACVPLLK